MKNQVAVIETDAVVATMSRARAALAEAKTIQETKRIVDAAAAAEIYARRQKLGEETSDLALSIKVEALRKLGEMLATSPKAAGTKGQKLTRVSGGAEVEPPERSEVATLADLGLTKKESAVAQKLAALPEAEFQQVRDGHVTVAKAIAAVDAAKAAAPARQAAPAAPPPAAHDPADDDGVIGAADLLDDMRRDLERAEATAAEFERVLKADDTKAKLAELVRRLEHAERRQAELMQDAAALKVQRDRYERALHACGKAVGELDLDRVVGAVRAMAKTTKATA